MQFLASHVFLFLAVSSSFSVHFKKLLFASSVVSAALTRFLTGKKGAQANVALYLIRWKWWLGDYAKFIVAIAIG